MMKVPLSLIISALAGCIIAMDLWGTAKLHDSVNMQICAVTPEVKNTGKWKAMSRHVNIEPFKAAEK